MSSLKTRSSRNLQMRGLLGGVLCTSISTVGRLDRPGLLSANTSILSSQKLSMESAKRNGFKKDQVLK